MYQHTFEDSLHTIAFLPLRMDFGINNRYLSDIEVEGIHIPVYFDLSPVKQDRSLPVTSVTGEEVFSWYLMFPGWGRKDRIPC